MLDMAKVPRAVRVHFSWVAAEAVGSALPGPVFPWVATRYSYGAFQCRAPLFYNNCITFVRDVLEEGSVDTPWLVSPRPNSYIKELQDADGAQRFGFDSTGFQGVFRVNGRIDSNRLRKALSDK